MACAPAGVAITFFTEEDSGHLRPIANVVKSAGGEVPDWMLHLKRDKNRRRLPPTVCMYVCGGGGGGCNTSCEIAVDEGCLQRATVRLWQVDSEAVAGG